MDFAEVTSPGDTWLNRQRVFPLRRGKPQGLCWPLALLGMALLAFLVGGLMPGELRAGIEQRLTLPFALPPVAHVVLCAVMAASLCRWRPGWHSLVVLFVVVMIGGLAELGQYWVPNRFPSWQDMGLDLAGAIIGVTVLRVRRRRR